MRIRKRNSPKKLISYKPQAKRSAFTLMELLVATALFTIIISIITGAFVQALRGEKSIVAITSANQGVAQSIEQISREIRTGQDFSNSTADVLSFTNYKGESVSYKLLSDQKVIGRCVGASCASDDSYQAITSEKAKVDSLVFHYLGVAAGDGSPPRVTISIVLEGPNGSKINLETTVAPYDLGT